MKHTTRGRAGFTLLEILLALALTVLLLTALYVAVSVQMNLAKTGRNLVERTTLARAIFARLSTDISAATTICDPARYRRDVANASGAATYSADSTSTGSGMTETPPMTETSPMTGTTGAVAPVPMGTTSSGLAPSTTTATAMTSLTGPAILPIGVVGDGSTLQLILTKLPRETWRQPPSNNRYAEVEIGVRQEDGTQLVSDLRVVSYWLAGDPSSPLGLARHEAKIVTTNDALNLALPDPNIHERFIIAPEVKSVSFEYFDGASWMTSWDSNTPGEDGLTPMGPPRAIRISLEIDFSETRVGAANDQQTLKMFRHVVAISTANGAPMIELENPSASTMPTEGSTTPSPETTPSTGSTP